MTTGSTLLNCPASSHSCSHRLIICLTDVIIFEYNPNKIVFAFFSLPFSGNDYFNDLIRGLDHTERLNLGNIRFKNECTRETGIVDSIASMGLGTHFMALILLFNLSFTVYEKNRR